MALDQHSDLPVSKPNIDNELPVRDGVNGDYYDSEKGTRHSRIRWGNGDGKIGGRIAPVLPHLRGYDFGESDSGSEILGKQIELEAGNALQYRTCSWQKVCAHCPCS